jgi:hypothetical protein
METIEIEPIAASITPSARVRVFPTSVRIEGLTVTRPAVLEYLRAIADGKQELALMHALDVGVAEILARRRVAG